MSLNGSAEVPRLYAAQLRTPLFMHAAHNGQDDPQWHSVAEASKASPETGRGG